METSHLGVGVTDGPDSASPSGDGAIARQRVESRQRWAHFGSKRTFLDPLVGWSCRHRPRSTCAAVPDGDDNDGGLIAVHGQPAGWVLDLASALLAGAVAGTVVGAIVGAVAVADASWPPASGFGRASASLRQEAEVVHNRLQIQRLAVVVVLDVAEGVHDDQHVGGRELVLPRGVVVVRIDVAVGAEPRSVLFTAAAPSPDRISRT